MAYDHFENDNKRSYLGRDIHALKTCIPCNHVFQCIVYLTQHARTKQNVRKKLYI